MGIGINSNWSSLHAANLMGHYTNSLQTSVERITSGTRINSAKDDPAGLGVSERFRNRIGALNQAAQNLQNDTSLLKTADSTLSNTVDIINRLKELAVQVTDGALTSADKTVIADQAGLLLNQIDHNATVKFGEKKISGESFSFQIGGEANHNVSLFMDAFDVKSLSKDSTTGTGVTAAGFSADDIKTKFTDPINNKLITTYKTTANGREVENTGVLDAMLENALAAQTKIGGWENVFGYVAEGISSESTNLQSADSALRDTDIAKEMSNYVKNNILLQASQFIAAQNNQNAYSVLNLLQ